MNVKRLKYLNFCWNVRGLGSSPKCNDIRDAISFSSPHIVCLQETKIRDLPPLRHPPFLPSYLDAHMAIPAVGSRGGLITAWNTNLFKQQSYIARQYSLTISLASTSSELSFSLTNVYAPADHAFIYAFLHELRDLSSNVTGAWLLIGDFNLLRATSDKNNTLFSQTLADSFNACINSLALLELPLLDRLFTWSNKRQIPTLARLDHALFNTEFSSMFPNSMLTSRIRSTSDHVPLLATLTTDIPKPNIFRFENAWLKHPLFLATTLPAWSSSQPRNDAACSLVARAKAFRQVAKVWKKQHNPPSIYHNCRFLILLIDLLEENRSLCAGERLLRSLCQDRLSLFVQQRAAH